MTNGDKIRQMSNTDLADYIYAVYLTGQYKVKFGITKFFGREINYKHWLEQVVEDEINEEK